MPNTHKEQDFMLQSCHCVSTSSTLHAKTKFVCQSTLARARFREPETEVCMPSTSTKHKIAFGHVIKTTLFKTEGM
ncbi:hypothetical protein EGK_17080 [Macaca mulatta]|uniref:Uncharacterized protein n=2 Tax=Macaca TaxID=9539 RepID=G7MVS4_MACMU|nr:hypothetical protein EGK_17080 [Macaca mulatta]EHH54715.1 hypothetical protein EGM_15606 [Macaca fascicularis]